GDENFRNGGGFRPTQIVGNCRYGVLMGDQVFSLSAAGNDSENALALSPASGPCAVLYHFAGKFQARNLLRNTRRRRIAALSLKQVSAVQPGRVNAYENFFLPGLRLRHIADFQYFWSAGAGDNDSFHACDLILRSERSEESLLPKLLPTVAIPRCP